MRIKLSREYRGVPSLFLEQNYWRNAIGNMLNRNSKMKFIVVTDDPQYFRKVFNHPVNHFNIGCDYYIVNNAKNLIISNSAFGIFSTWTNQNNPYVIAPFGWARHNLNYWANSDVWTFGLFGKWQFLNIYGKIDNWY